MEWDMKFSTVRGFVALRSTYPDIEQNLMTYRYRGQTLVSTKLAFCIHCGE
jgi:hypothetical protein